MALTLSIPAIAITPEAEEDDDNSFMNLAEALTDIEELYDDNVISKKVVTRNKLKIKVTENDGYSTALEDMEASDDEDFITIKTHHTPIILDAIDMEQYSVEENQGSTEQYIKKYDHLNTNNNSNKNGIEVCNKNFINSAITDIEDYDTDNEVENEEDENYNEIVLDLDYDEAIQSIKISDEIQDVKQSWSEEPPKFSDKISNYSYQSNDLKLNRKRAPTFREMFRAQNKANGNNIKTRRKKRNRMRSNKESRTFDGAESSDTESLVDNSKKNKVKWSNMNSLNYDSDVESNQLPFPLCKKTFEKKKILLETPDNNNVNSVTDVEDIECDIIDFSEKNLAIDNEIIQEQLDEMSGCYSFTRDKNESKIKEPDQLVQKPIENQQTKSSSSFRDYLLAPATTDGGFTETECLDSSDEDESEINEDVKKGDATEEEDFDSDVFLDAFDTPEIPLPPTSRLLIISEEKNTLIPTMRILPLDENIDTDSDIESPCTDDESVNSSIDDSLNTLIRDLPSPLIGNLEGGSTKDFENYVNSKVNQNTLYEELTDTEYLHPEQNRFSKPKKSKIGNFLQPNDIPYSVNNTDVESLYSVSCNSDGVSDSTLPYYVLTDLEYLIDSSDNEEEITKEPSKKCNKMKFQRGSRFLSIGLTDTEDIMASTDDELTTFSRAETATPYKLRNELYQASSIQINIENSSKIDCSAPEEAMYLKGGGFQEVLTDTEELMVDSEAQRSEAIEAWEYFNCQTEEDESSMDRNIPVPKAKGGGGEETGEQFLRQQFNDQHQLSEEMKELLKEMEKTSEQ